jgi:U3 small nucleolar RNA-associated protein 4
MFDSVDSIWEGDARKWAKHSESLNSTRFVEIVASPNNPTAFLQEGVLEGQNVRSVYDHAYYWPHFTAIIGPANEDVMLFTLSKLTGHAGSRLG